YTNGSGGGWWGPIVETFDTYTNVNPVGFDLIRLFQDGNADPLWLTAANTYLRQDAPSPWQLLSLAPDTSFTVGVSAIKLPVVSNVVGPLGVIANTTADAFPLNPSPPAGQISPAWVITPNSNTWEKTEANLPPGSYQISFNRAPGLVPPPPQTFSITGGNVT